MGELVPGVSTAGQRLGGSGLVYCLRCRALHMLRGEIQRGQLVGVVGGVAVLER